MNEPMNEPRYTIHWGAIRELPPAGQLAELARIGEDVRAVTAAERARIVHAEIARRGGGHGSQRAAAEALGLKPARMGALANQTPITVNVDPVDESDPAILARQAGEVRDYSYHVCFDLEGRTLHVESGWDGMMSVGEWTGMARRWAIPALTARAANRTMEQIRPLCERIASDYTTWTNHEWQTCAELGDDARAAEAEIKAILAPVDGWPEDELVTIEDGADPDAVDAYAITADTTDAELDEIAEQITDELAAVAPSGAAVIVGLEEQLRARRAE